MTDPPDFIPISEPGTAGASGGVPYGRPVNEVNPGLVGLAPMPQVRTFPLSFTGTSAEFFRIWIVNVALSVVTLGLYTPWARVRTRQYFYGNTWVDGHNFEYTANPWALLRGYLLVAALFGTYNAAMQFQFQGWEWVVGIVVGLFVLLYPWLVRQSLRFLARSTVHRGLHFSFQGSLGQAYVTYGLANVAAGFVGLALPWAWFMQRRYQVEGVHYGQASGRFRGDVGPFFIFGLTGLGLTLGGVILLLGLGLLGFGLFSALDLGSLADWEDLSAASMTGIVAALATAYLVFLLVYLGAWQYVRAATMKYVLNNVELGGVVRLGATFSPWRLVWITLSNTAAQLLTLGLLTPWAAVRRMNYLAPHIQVRAIADLDDFTAEMGQQESALGEAATELLDINLGF
ncbi:YjgN family protein [Deinococcus fonticola]|uniref:YjgN family protein n=1 Tax=Deinococcus fonticola TaxID=2528713 RepID=UPI001F10BEF4|nr:DUF898 domain-containing protein [Deinococcus fonticola]